MSLNYAKGKSWKFSFGYDGSKFWLIFFAIFFFPLAFLLLFMNSIFYKDGIGYRFYYSGSHFWLCFWILAFFPIAIILGLINGIELIAAPKK